MQHAQTPTPPTGPVVKLSTKHTQLPLGSAGEFDLHLSNPTDRTFVLEAPEPIGQWLVLTDRKGSPLPSYHGRVVEPAVPFPSAFVTLAPGETVSYPFRLYWLSLEESQSLVSNVNGVTNRNVHFLDQVAQYTGLETGVFNMWFHRPPRSVDKLKTDDGWVAVGAYFGAEYFADGLLSSKISIEFIESGKGRTDGGKP